MSNQPEYSYKPKGSIWGVYYWKYFGDIATGTKVYESLDRELAKKECFRLNNWKYKEPFLVKYLAYKSNVNLEDMPEWLKLVVTKFINPRLNMQVVDGDRILNKMRDDIADLIRKQHVRIPVLVEIHKNEKEKGLFVIHSGTELISLYKESY